MKKFHLLCFLLLPCFGMMQAQDTAGRYRILNPEMLADSVIAKLETAKKAEVLKPYFPPLNLFMQAADSVKTG